MEEEEEIIIIELLLLDYCHITVTVSTYIILVVYYHYVCNVQYKTLTCTLSFAPYICCQLVALFV